MTKKTLAELQEKHSELCAQAADRGVSVPEDLTIDFDSAEVGSAVVATLEGLVNNRVGVDQKDVAEGSEEEHAAAIKPKKAKSKKRAETIPVPDANTEGENTVATKSKST